MLGEVLEFPGILSGCWMYGNSKILKLALEIINMTPIRDKIMPKNCLGYVGVLKINQEKKMINNGVIDVIIDELITIDVWSDK